MTKDQTKEMREKREAETEKSETVVVKMAKATVVGCCRAPETDRNRRRSVGWWFQLT
jgi:hypothetical protein